MGTSPKRNAQALSDQLVAEISASRYRSVRRVAAELDEDYSTFYRWVKNKRPIRMETVYAILDLLDIESAVFFTRVQERAESARPKD